MINRICLQIDGAISSEGRIIEADPVACLAASVDLAGGYRMRSFFKMLEKYPLLQNLNPFLPALMGRYRSMPEAPLDANGGEHLEINKNIEIIGFPGNAKLDIYTSLKRVETPSGRGINSAGLETMIDMPLRLGNLKHVIFGDRVDELEFETIFTLFEFIEGVAWEISFWGNPRQCEIKGGQ